MLTKYPVSQNRFIRMKELCSITGLSRSTIYLYVAQGKFPSPKRLGGSGGRAIGWEWLAVEAWLAERPRVESEAYA